MDVIIWLIVNIGCGLLFLGIGIHSSKAETPVNFWSGTEVDPSTISDAKKYNKANSIMWIVYSLLYFASAIVYIFNESIGIILLMFAALGCIPILIWIYTKICKKYRNKD